jgi:hypothetical protein
MTCNPDTLLRAADQLLEVATQLTNLRQQLVRHAEAGTRRGEELTEALRQHRADQADGQVTLQSQIAGLERRRAELIDHLAAIAEGRRG